MGEPALSIRPWWEKPAANDETVSGVRYISEDPIGFRAGINFYVYVNNNPLNANDPSGLACSSCVHERIKNAVWQQSTSNFFEGVISYPRGLGRAVNFGTQISGLRGQELKARAQINLGVFNKLSSQAMANPDVVFDLARDFATKNPALVAGRLTAGVGTSFLLGRVANPRITPLVGLGLGGAAAFGDAITAIDQGARSFESLIPAVMGGQVNFQSNDPLGFNTIGTPSGLSLYPSKPNTNTLQSVYRKK